MRLVGYESPEMELDGSEQNDWGNLPYTIIHNIAKVDIQIVIVQLLNDNRLLRHMQPLIGYTTTLRIRKSGKAFRRH